MTDVDPQELATRIAAGSAPRILDVRSRAEFEAGHVPGAIHIPFWAVGWRAGELRAAVGDPIVVYCGHGPRAHLARAVLKSRGFRNLASLSGHWTGWRAVGLPEERG
jgi:rhodanese-related sulfurtransferase